MSRTQDVSGLLTWEELRRGGSEKNKVEQNCRERAGRTSVVHSSGLVLVFSLWEGGTQSAHPETEGHKLDPNRRDLSLSCVLLLGRTETLRACVCARRRARERVSEVQFVCARSGGL